MSNVNDWIWLHIPCPVDGCPNNEISYWSHKNCIFMDKDHDIKINSSGFLKCVACNSQAALINWKFDCGYGHGLKNLSRNSNKLYEIINVMNHTTTDKEFILRLMGAISNMFLSD